MTAIREFAKVNNGMLNIKLPEYFDYEDVEVVIMPRIDKSDLSYLNNEVEKGMNSKISNKSHEEIFKEIKVKYENSILDSLKGEDEEKRKEKDAYLFNDDKKKPAFSISKPSEGCC